CMCRDALDESLTIKRIGDIESQIRLALTFIWSMAMEAVLGQNRSNFAIKLNAIFAASHACDQAQNDCYTNSKQGHYRVEREWIAKETTAE
ncbi:MAG: hypothetical protein ABL921_26270, partial [Pirellula sp.]